MSNEESTSEQPTPEASTQPPAEETTNEGREDTIPNPLDGKVESDADEAVAAIDDQHREVMSHIINEAINAVVKVESTAAAMVAAGVINPEIKEDQRALTDKLLTSHRGVEARAYLTAACALLRLAGIQITEQDIKTYDGLADALVRDNIANFQESFEKSVEDTIEKMTAEGKPELAVVSNSSDVPNAVKEGSAIVTDPNEKGVA